MKYVIDSRVVLDIQKISIISDLFSLLFYVANTSIVSRTKEGVFHKIYKLSKIIEKACKCLKRVN